MKSRFGTRVVGAVTTQRECDAIYKKAFGPKVPLIRTVEKFNKDMAPLLTKVEGAFRDVDIAQLETPNPGFWDIGQATLQGRTAVEVAIERVRQEELQRFQQLERSVLRELRNYQTRSPSTMDLATGKHDIYLKHLALAQTPARLALVHQLATAGRLPASTAGIFQAIR